MEATLLTAEPSHDAAGREDSAGREGEVERLVTSREAFSALFRRYYVPLVRYAQRVTGDAASAADVVQDVFLKTWQGREALVIKVSAQAMLYTMVRNRALNQLRRRKWRAPDVDVDAVSDGGADDPGQEATWAAATLQEHLHRWIEALPPRRREAFTLSRYQGLSHSEIASIMNVSERTVDTHILLALRTLRQRLDDLQRDEDQP